MESHYFVNLFFNMYKSLPMNQWDLMGHLWYLGVPLIFHKWVKYHSKEAIMSVGDWQLTDKQLTWTQLREEWVDG